jgi:preprotein translocase subunit Sss1
MPYSVSSGNAALGAFFATMGIFAVVFAVAWYILQVVAYWRIFTKAGRPGWHSIIPILNEWDRTDLSWSRTMAWVLIACILLGAIFTSVGTTTDADGVTTTTFLGTVGYIISIIGALITIISEYKLAKAFGKGFGFFLGLVFLNPIFKIILGFGDAQYQGRQD